MVTRHPLGAQTVKGTRTETTFSIIYAAKMAIGKEGSRYALVCFDKFTIRGPALDILPTESDVLKHVIEIVERLRNTSINANVIAIFACMCCTKNILALSLVFTDEFLKFAMLSARLRCGTTRDTW